jgi:hypothetical protein
MTTIRWKSKEDREAWELDFAAMGSAVAHVNTDGLTEHVPFVDFYAVPPGALSGVQNGGKRKLNPTTNNGGRTGGLCPKGCAGHAE